VQRELVKWKWGSVLGCSKSPVGLACNPVKHIQKFRDTNISATAGLTAKPIIGVDLNTTRKECWDNVLVFRASYLCGFNLECLIVSKAGECLHLERGHGNLAASCGPSGDSNAQPVN
jgi:hypothetical protein